MWYTVLNKELSLRSEFDNKMHTIRAGSIYAVRKYANDVLARPVEGESAKQYGMIELTVAEARAIFTKPTSSFSDAVEQSIMQSEANYC